MIKRYGNIERSFLLLVLLIVIAYAAFAPFWKTDTDNTGADRLQGQLIDYPDLARYREANAKLGPPARGENRVVFFGDSITDGWNLDHYFPGEHYINRGIGGQSTPNMLLRFRPDVVDLKPKVVVILAGTNDISSTLEQHKLETIKSNFLSMVDLARANGINVVIASVTPVGDYNKDASGQQLIVTRLRPPAMINEVNEWLKELCSQRGSVYLDYFSAMTDEKGLLKAEISDDGLHPNNKGYAVMTPLAQAAIETSLKK